MQVFTLPLTETNLLHPLAKAYIHDEPGLKNYYSFPPTETGIKDAIGHRKNFPVNRKLLSEKLKQQYLNTDPDFFAREDNSKVSKSIDLLQNNKNTFTITTGHQLNVFTGPLYFIYKIISVIQYTKWLKEKFPENNFIPVYWMATEDHDLQEISHIHLYGKKFQWEAEEQGAVGRMNPYSLEEQISFAGDLIANKAEGQELIKLFKKSYLHQPTLSLATRQLVHSLFKEDGLIIIDADENDFKREFIPVMKKELLEQTSEKCINKTLEILHKNFKTPVNPRPINLFYLTENKRVRIEKTKKGEFIATPIKKWTEQEIIAELELYPENFSPNVVLRPVYQEILLPNLAYIGGNNEIAYWLELKSTFDAFGIFFPQLLVRDSALWIGKKFTKELSEMKLQPTDLLLPLTELKNLFYDRNHLRHKSEEQMDRLIEETEKLKTHVKGLAPTLAAMIVKQCNQHIKDFKKLKKDLRKQREEEHAASLQKLEKIHQSLNPDGSFQERYDNFISYYLQYGQSFYQLLKDNFNPLDASIKIFAEEERTFNIEH